MKESSMEFNRNLTDNNQQGINQFDQRSENNKAILERLIQTNTVDSSIIKTTSNLLTNKDKSQSTPSLNIFTNNPHNPQRVMIQNSHIGFRNGYKFDQMNSHLFYFITNTKIQKKLQKHW